MNMNVQKMMRRMFPLAAALALSGIATIPIAAFAQAAKVDTTDTIEEVIVTARHRTESLHDTPVAVTAISVDALASMAAPDSTSLQGTVPNLLLTPQNAGAASANLSLRGLGFADVEKSFEPTVGVAIDGVFLGTSTGQVFDMFDVADIQVLRGPQGELFGANTIGGVINVTRTKPTGKFGIKAEFGYGSYNSTQERIVANAPLNEGILAAKLFYFGNKTDGFYTLAQTGKHTGGSDNKHYGLSLLLTPTDTTFSALLTLEQQEQNFVPIESNIANSSELFCLFEPARECNRNSGSDLYTVFTTGPATGHFKMPSATLNLDFNLGGVSITSVTGYRESSERQTQDFDASSADLYFTNIRQNFHQFSQELRATGKISDTLDYVLGGFYYEAAYERLQDTRLFGAWLPFAQRITGGSKSIAGFADLDWQFAEKWRLNVGGRYTKDDKKLTNSTGGQFLGSPSASFSKFTPKAGVDFRPNDDVMLYASFSRGYRAGGFSNRAQTAISTNTSYQPETVDSTELGAKLEFFDKRLSLNSALFHAKYQNMQQSTTIPGGPTGNETIITNVGSAVINGAEFELMARPVKNLTINAALGLLSSHFSDFLTKSPVGAQLRTFDYSNVNMIYAPKMSSSLGVDYKIPADFGEVRTHLGYRHIGKYDQQISNGLSTPPPATGVIVVSRNDPRVVAAAQNLLDASVTFEGKVGQGRAHLTLYGRNLTDHRGPVAAFTVAGLWSFASAQEPRVFGAQLGYEF